MENFEQKKEVANDMETALFLIRHIENPCEDLNGNNIRDFYIREAKRELNTMRDEEAKKILNDIINKYLDKKL